MDSLFTLYRYLVNNRHQSDHKNPYNVALQTLENYLDMERSLATYADKIRQTGGLDFADAEKLTAHLEHGFETAILLAHESAPKAVAQMVCRYIGLSEIDEVIEACQEEKARMEREEREESEASEEED